MAAQDVTVVLQRTYDSDGAVRASAEAQMREFMEKDYASYIVSLTAELANEQKPEFTRRLAGLMLKNSLDSKDDAVKEKLTQRWQSVDAVVRDQIKQALLRVLTTSEAAEVRRGAAQAIAKVASIDMADGAWPDLMEFLMKFTSADAGVSAGVRTNTLEAIGYVCEELAVYDGDLLSEKETNDILNAVVKNIGETDVQIAATAMQALSNALTFARSNFERQPERDYIMSVVCTGCTHSSPDVRQNAYECLSSIAEQYYDKLQAYMQAIWQLTVKAVTEDSDEVALQALGLWYAIAEYESTELPTGEDGAPVPGFIKQAAHFLVPMLIKQLTKQEEGQEHDEGAWNLSVAGATILDLSAPMVGDAVVELVMPFVQENIAKRASEEDWRWREAATIAFGSILAGPSPQHLVPLVREGLTFLLKSMEAERHSMVLDTTIWAIGRIFEHAHLPDVITPQLPDIVRMLLAALGAEEHLARKASYALVHLAEGFPSDGPAQNNPMMSFIPHVIGHLLKASERDSVNLQVDAFEAINAILETLPPDTSTIQLLIELQGTILQRLKVVTASSAASVELRERQSEVQGHLCTVLWTIMRKLCDSDLGTAGKEAEAPLADGIMVALLEVITSHPGTVHQQALNACGQLAWVVGDRFDNYMHHFWPILTRALEAYQQEQTLRTALGVLSDVTREIGLKILPHCDQLMTLLLQLLQKDDVRREVKPQILSALGDVALAIEEEYQKYLGPVLQTLSSASALSLQAQQRAPTDDAMADYNNELREGIFEAYAGIMAGLSPVTLASFPRELVTQMLQLLQGVARDEYKTPEVCRAATNFMGDLARYVPSTKATWQAAENSEWISMLVQACQSVEDGQEAAGYAAGAIKGAINGS